MFPIILLGEKEIGQAGGEASSGVSAPPTRGLIHTPAAKYQETWRLQSHLSQRNLILSGDGRWSENVVGVAILSADTPFDPFAYYLNYLELADAQSRGHLLAYSNK